MINPPLEATRLLRRLFGLRTSVLGKKVDLFKTRWSQ